MTQRNASRGNRAGQSGPSPVARRSMLGWPGFLFVGITVFLAVGAINSQNNLLFWVFGVAVAGVIVSGVVSGSGLMGVRLVAHPVRTLEAGVPGEISYTLESTNRRLGVFGLEIREAAVENESKESGGTGLCDAAGGVPYLAPKARERATLRWTPPRRGLLELDRIGVESRFPFGLLVKTLEFSSPRRALVLPCRLELRHGVFDAGRSGMTGGTSKRSRSGAGSEFYSIREYTPGDPRRIIAWRPSARRGDLLVVERTEPRSRSLWVWVTKPDGQPSSEDERCISERAFSLALALVREGARQHRSVGVWMPWAGVTIAPGSGRAFEHRIGEALALVDLDTPAGGLDADAPPPGSSEAEMLLIPLGTPPAEASAHPRQLTFDPREPSDWLASGAELPAPLMLQRKAGRR